MRPSPGSPLNLRSKAKQTMLSATSGEVNFGGATAGSASAFGRGYPMVGFERGEFCSAEKLIFAAGKRCGPVAQMDRAAVS